MAHLRLYALFTIGISFCVCSAEWIASQPKATVSGVLRCLESGEEMVTALGMTAISHLETCGSSVVYVDLKQTIVLKHYMLFSEHTPREREVCALHALQRFRWAPRLLCAGRDYILTSYTGKPACRDITPNDYLIQVDAILSDMRSVRMRHNDLRKVGQTDFTLLDGRVYLTDFGWATMDGNLMMECIPPQSNGVRLVPYRMFCPQHLPWSALYIVRTSKVLKLQLHFFVCLAGIELDSAKLT